jgi:hypothetical protein
MELLTSHSVDHRFILGGRERVAEQIAEGTETPVGSRDRFVEAPDARVGRSERARLVEIDRDALGKLRERCRAPLEMIDPLVLGLEPGELP